MAKTSDKRKTKSQLIEELQSLRQQVAELRAPEERRKRAEDVSWESEERLRVLLESVPTGIVVTDAETHEIVDANPAAIEMIGASLEQVIGSVCHNYICPAEKGRCPITDLGQIVDKSERVLLTPGGESVPILKTVAPVTLNGRELLLESFVDITEHKQTERALRKSEGKYRVILDSIEEAYYEVDLAGNLTFFNDVLCEMLGYARDELMGANYRQYTGEEDVERVYQTFNTVYQTKEPAVLFDWEIIRKDGAKRLVEASASLMTDPVGDEPIGFRGIVRDITERVRIEAIRVRAEAEATKLNREWAALNEVGQAFVSALDLSETLTIITDRTTELLGAAAASVILHDEARGDLCFVAASGEGADFVRDARFELGQGIAGWVVQQGEAVIVSDVMEDERFFGDFDEKSGLTTRSILCAPLQVKGQVIGAIEVMNKEEGTFDQEDLRFLTSLAAPAAIAIENARLFGESQARAKELAVLNRLSQALTARLSVEEVLEEAYRQIARLVDTTNFYIGLYDPDKEEVAIPFMVSKSEIDQQITVIPADQGFTGYIIRNRTSVLVEENVVGWLEEQGIDAVGEPSLSWLGVPLIISDRVLGMMAVQSYTTPRLYDEHDLDLLTAIAGSTAIAIQNARLYEQAQREITERKRAEEALSHEQHLLNALMDNVPDHIYFKDAEGRFTRINKAYAERFGLSDPTQVVGKTDFDFLTEEHAQSAYEDEQEIIKSGQPMVKEEEYVWPDGRETWASVVKLPLRDEEGQIVGAFGISRDITARKWAEEVLEKRALRLQTAVEISRIVSSILDPGELISKVVDLIRERFDLYYAGLFLLDEVGDWAVLRAGTGKAGRQMLEQSHKLEIGGESMIGWCVAHEQARIALDVGEEAVRFENPLLPETRSELALPLISRGKIVGALTIQSVREAAFDEEDIAVLQTMADQLANAIENARLVGRTEVQLREMERLYGEYSVAAWADLLSPERPLGYVYDRVDVLPVAESSLPVLDAPLERGEPETSGPVLAVPLKLRGQSIGVLGVQESDDTREWSPEEIALIHAVGDQVAMALENARLFGETQQRAGQWEALTEVGQAIGSILNLDEVLQLVLERLKNIVFYDAVALWLREGEAMYIRAGQGFEADIGLAVPIREDALFQELVSAQQPLVIADAQQDERFRGLVGTEWVRSWLGVPLLSKGEVIGLLTIDKREPGSYTAEMGELAFAFGQQAAMAIENARLFEETRRHLEHITALYDIGQEITSTLDLGAVLQAIVEDAARLVGCDQALITMLDTGQRKLLQLVGHGYSEEYLQSITFEELWSGLTGWVLREGKPALTEDMLKDERETGAARERSREFPIGSVAVAPLMIKGQAIGTLTGVNFPGGAIFTQEDLNLLVTLASQTAIAIENARLFEETQQRAETMRRLYDLSSALMGVESSQQALTLVTNTAHQLVGATIATAYVYDEVKEEYERAFALADSVQPEWETSISPRPGGLTARIIQEGLTVFIADTAIDERANPRLAAVGLRSMLGVPIQIVGQKPIGALFCNGEEAGQFDDDDLQLITLLANRAAAALRTLRLGGEIKASLAETETLYQASAELSMAQTYHDILVALHEYTVLNQADRNVTIDMFDRPWTAERVPDEINVLARLKPVSSEVSSLYSLRQTFPTSPAYLRSDALAIISDVETDPRVGENLRKMMIEQFQTRCTIFVPLVVGGQWVGYINGMYSETTEFPEVEIRRLMSLAGQAATAIQGIRLFEETERRAVQLAAASEVARDATAILDVDQLLDETVHLISEQFGFYHVGVFTLDEWNRYAVLRAASSEGGRRMLERGHQLRVGEVGMVGYVAETGEPRIALDVGTDAVFFDNPDLPNTHSAMTLPLKVRGRVIGALDVQSTQSTAFSKDDVAVLQTMADQLATAIANARLFQDARAEAQRRALISEMLQVAATSLDQEDLLHRAGEVISQRLEAPSALFVWDTAEKVLRTVAVHDSKAADVPLPEAFREMTRAINPVLFEAAEKRRTSILGAPLPDQREATRLSPDQREATRLFPDQREAGQLSDASGPLVAMTRREHALFNIKGSEAAHSNIKGSEAAHSIIYVPLISRDQVLGMLGIGRLEDQPLVDVEFAELVAANLSVAVENARLYQEAVQTAERLTEVDRLKSQFLANMSHELRTPLNSIIGFSRVILKEIDGPLTDMQRTDLQAVYNSGQHLLGLINDILEVAKMDSGKMELVSDVVNLQDIARGVMSTAIALIKDKPGIKLQQAVPKDLPTIIGDTRRIRQAILNLVSNAAKFTEEGFIRVGAEVAGDVDNKHPREVIISVADSGIGIPPDKIDVIFEPFTQADSSTTREAGGTGLGLSITSSFVKMHGGRMWVESEVGVGSTFYMALPIQGTSLFGEEVGEEQLEPGPEPERKTILCVEDDDGVITLFRRYLSKQGYKVVGLTDSTVAVERARELQPFAITLDVMMPGKDGWQVIQELKADPETCDIPVIMCTIVEEKEYGLSLGAAGYLLKPILEHDLLAVLNRLDRKDGQHLVLVVDDQPDDRELLRRMIEIQEGYRVIEAGGGQEAIAAIQRTPPDIIILDLMMPNVDGFAVLEAVKTDKDTRSIPIIVVTAKELTKEERETLNSGVEALLQKGIFEQQELLADVAEALERLRDKAGEEQG